MKKAQIALTLAQLEIAMALQQLELAQINLDGLINQTNLTRDRLSRKLEQMHLENTSARVQNQQTAELLKLKGLL